MQRDGEPRETQGAITSATEQAQALRFQLEPPSAVVLPECRGLFPPYEAALMGTTIYFFAIFNVHINTPHRKKMTEKAQF